MNSAHKKEFKEIGIKFRLFISNKTSTEKNESNA